ILLALAKRLERKARFAAFYAANAPKFRIGVELQMGFGTGAHKNRISCDFRFEIGIAACPSPPLDKDARNTYSYSGNFRRKRHDRKVLFVEREADSLRPGGGRGGPVARIWIAPATPRTA
ncbi:MAG: hypothetical protein LBT33_09360, partial [Spirochaetia bacterium]|nr:hypothetical protein [Spirochaetia bacterium]